jgi:tRNA (cmo5U34)-methyltransferase
MSKESKIILNRYNAVAPYYDRLAKMVFGNSIRISQLVHLPLIPEGGNILILGGGSGWLLKEVMLRSPRKVWYVEASSAMISLSKKSIPDNGYVVFVHGGLDSIPSSVVFDVVLANFFLDQFSDGEIREMLEIIYSALDEQGLLLVTDFQKDAFWKQVFLKVMYLFFNVAGAIRNHKLPDWNGTVRERGFRPIAEATFYARFIRSVAFRKQIQK